MLKIKSIDYDKDISFALNTRRAGKNYRMVEKIGDNLLSGKNVMLYSLGDSQLLEKIKTYIGKKLKITEYINNGKTISYLLELK